MAQFQKKIANENSLSDERHGKHRLDQMRPRLAKHLVMFRPTEEVLTTLVAAASREIPGLAPISEVLRVFRHNPDFILALARKSRFDESAPDGDWMVRSMTARNAEKTYICPGCSTAVLPGVAHLVVWADDHLFGAAAGLAERRHWHTNCWTSRNFRYR